VTELRGAVETLAAAWGEPLPTLRDPAVDRIEASGGITVVPLGAAAAAAAPGVLWDDAATAAFYENLPELAALVPALALGRGTDESVATDGGGGADGSEAGSGAPGDSAAPSVGGGSDATTPRAGAPFSTPRRHKPRRPAWPCRSAASS
jgi:hypothetical protein